MNPILTSGLFGLFKGLAAGPSCENEDRTYANFGAPVLEETIYRGGLSRVLPPGFSAAIFALDHIRTEKLSGSSAVARFADVLAGGILYEKAYKAHGIFGAIAAHALHNILGGVGRGLSPMHTIAPRRRKRR